MIETYFLKMLLESLEGVLMESKFVNASFSVKFPKQLNIRRCANNFEDILEEKYSMPQVFGVPDDIEPMIPRIVFNAKHGHSVIQYSQLSADLNANYDNEFNNDLEECLEYLDERTKLVMSSLKSVGIEQFIFAGITIKVNIKFSEKMNVVKYLTDIFNKEIYKKEIYDVEYKIALVEDEKYFKNIRVSNYRTFQIKNPNQEIISTGNLNEVEQGISLILDVNNRASYNSSGNMVGYEKIEQEVIQLMNITKKNLKLYVDKIKNQELIE